MKRWYELKSCYDARPQFYRKAWIEEGDGESKLYSYETLVCIIKNGVAQIVDTYSATTLRHIKEFLKQHGFKAENKEQISRDYMVENF